MKSSKKYIIVEWPYTQKLLDYSDFEEHCCLINDESWLAQYGPMSYFVEESWLKQINNDKNI